MNSRADDKVIDISQEITKPLMNLRRRDRPTKTTARAQPQLIQEVTEEARTTCIDLQASLKTRLHDSTIRKGLSSSKVKTLLNKQQSDYTKDFGQNFSWVC